MTLTLQEIFDKNWDWFIVQGKPQSYQNGLCEYRSKCGTLRCAIGVVIPDNVYSPYMEGQALSSLLDGDDFPAIKALFGKEIWKDLYHLQYIHDSYSGNGTDFTERTKSLLTQFATTRGLKIP